MNFKFFFHEAFNSLVRNWVMSMAAIVTVLVSMFVLGLGLIIFFNFQHAISDLRNKLEVEVFIKNTASPDEINGLGDQIRAMPEVKDVNFVSKDEALDRLRGSLKGHEDVLDALSGNPLPPSYEITLQDPSKIEEVASRFYDNPIVDNSPNTHDGVKTGGETSDRVLRVTTIFLIGGAGFVMLLTVASVLLISNTTRLSIFARRREVEIMRLVGATNWFIRWPFVLEGVFTGMVGALAASMLVIIANRFIIEGVVNKMPFLPFNAEAVPMFWLVLLVVIGGTLLGSVGSGLALRRFLKI
ncbi:MAG: permease-like cell division protein FtsX [Thermoleophilia bacterium]